MRILIIGGTRFLGPPVVRSLHEQGPLSPSFTAVTLHQLPYLAYSISWATGDRSLPTPVNCNALILTSSWT